MTAPVLSPVRWWRDDTTRYDDRPLVGVCRDWTQPKSDLEWAWDLVMRPPDPELQRALAELTDPMRLVSAMGIPDDLLYASTPAVYRDLGIALDEYRRRIGLPEET